VRFVRRGLVAAVASGALLCGVLSVPAFAVPVGGVRAGDATKSVSARRGPGVAEQLAEPTLTKPPRVTWPKAAAARVDLRQAPVGGVLAVAPSGAVLPTKSGERGDKGAVVAVGSPTARQVVAAGTPPQFGFASGAGNFQPVAPSTSSSLIAAPVAVPAGVRVEVLERAKVKKAGGVGMGVRLTRTDKAAGPGPVRVSLDYSGFKDAYGGDFASRLRLVQVPACALTTPDVRGCSPDLKHFVKVDNDVKSGRLSATVFADADPAARAKAAASKDLVSQPPVAAASQQSVLMLTSGVSSDQGDYRATDLKPSGSWEVSTGSGDFTYSLPIQLPKAPFGKTPDLALSYDSQSVDGRTSATNNQASWVGMGWNLDVGFIERRYKSCSQDGLPNIGDMCWDSPNSGLEPNGADYVINLNGVNTELIQDNNGSGSYHLKDDPGWRVQHMLSGGHGSDAEYWVVSTQDGMRYYFGWGRSERTTSVQTNSVLTMPVVGNNSGEPCFDQYPKPCDEAWRWNLDRVVDPNEVENAYFYDKFVNHYRSVADTVDTARAYDAGSYLTRIEYGWASQLSGALLPAKVELTHVGRCVERMAEADPLGDEPPACPGISSNPSSYPDVPTDLICDGTAADNNCRGMTYYPTFFTTDMLWDIKTYVSDDGGTTWDPAMQYQTKHGLPNPDGTVGKTLWFDYMQRMGYGDGPDQRLPVINFNGEWLDNQVGSSTLNFRRVTKIYGDLGSVTSVSYGQPDACDASHLPSEASNTQDCFWQKWTPDGGSATSGWFKKYVVTQVSVDPGVGQGASHDGDPVMTTTYDYVGGAGWRFTSDPLTKDADESWSDWRGYQQVEVSTGTKSNAAATYYWLYRGLDGDRTSKTDSSLHRSVSVKDGFGDSWTDSAWLAGKTLEQSQRDGAGQAHERVRKEYWVHDTAQYAGLPDARFVRDSKTTTDTMTSQGWRESVVNDEYDDTSAVSTTYGLPVRTNDWGLVDYDDNRCTTYGRAYNTSTFPGTTLQRWMVFPDEVRHYAADCAARAASNQDAYAVTLFDGATTVDDNDTMLTDGNATGTVAYTDSDPSHARTTKTDYDKAGRVIATYDGKNNKTTTTYSPVTTWPTNGVTVTTPDPDGSGAGAALSTTTWYSRLWGTPYRVQDPNGQITQLVHDSVGRYVQIFRPTEAANYPSGTPSMAFDYTIPTGVNSDGVPDTITGPAKVTTSTLQSGTTALKSYQFLDGLGRTRETQSTAPDGAGRDTVSTRYDTSGNVTGTSAPFYNFSPAGSGMVLPTVADLPSYTDLVIDYAGRTTESRIMVNEVAQAAGDTRTIYHGDYTTVVPPTGEPTDTYTDVFGQTTQVVEHGPNGPATTSYQYTRSGDLSQITDVKGNTTGYTYNWAGERVRTDDPDAGVSTSTYDANGQVATSTDATGTLTYNYDALQRPTTTQQGTTTLSQLSYDSAAGGKGQLASAVSYANGKAYTQQVTGYDARGRTTGQQTIVPNDGTGLTGTYTVGYGYDLADHVTSVDYPAVGGLPEEKVTTHYTAQGLPDTVSSALATYQSSIGFDKQGRLNARAYGVSGGSDATVNRAYTHNDTNGTGVLSNITTTVTTGDGVTKTAQNDTFTRDLAGQITGSTDGVTKQSECFTYDELNRLSHAWTTQATDNCAGAAAPDRSSSLDPYDQQYGYDDIGNLTSVTDTTAAGATTRKYTYPGYSADGTTYTPEQPRPHAVTKAGNDTFGYNNAGQMTTRTVGGVSSTLLWNPQNRISSITQHKSTGDQASSYVYDAAGSPLIRISPQESVLYIDGHELHSAGSGIQATRLYSATGTTIAMRQADGTKNGKLTWLLGDTQASTSLFITTTGQVTRRRYTPFGKQRNTGGDLPAGLDRGFLGKAEDDSTQLSLLGARMYDPALGRFLSPDPLTQPYNPQNLSAYSYTDNNPINYIDPSGLGKLGGYSNPDGSGGDSCDGWDNCNGSDTRPSGGGGGGGGGPQVAPDGQPIIGGIRILTPRELQARGSGSSYGEQLRAWAQGLCDHNPGEHKTFCEVAHRAGLVWQNSEDPWGITATYHCLTGRGECGKALVEDIITVATLAFGSIGGEFLEAGAEAELAAEAEVEAEAISGLLEACSFTPDTRVAMADGTAKPIGKIKTGDKVEAGNPKSGKHQGGRTVTATHINHDNDLVDLTIDTGHHHTAVIHTTSKHPFWDYTSHTWIPAGQLKLHHNLETESDGHALLIAIHTRPGAQDMWNLTVQQLHTYYVFAGAIPVLVHNTCPIHTVGGPRVRPGTDIDVDADGMVDAPTDAQLESLDVQGLSTFDSVQNAGRIGLRGQVRTPTGSLPDGLGIISDGRGVGGPRAAGHHTIYPTRRMSFDEYVGLIKGMEWENIGTKL
jgi:RHS repeat-associated protein